MSFLSKFLKPLLVPIVKDILKETISSKEHKMKLNSVILKDPKTKLDKFIYLCSTYPYEITILVKTFSNFHHMEERIRFVNFADMYDFVKKLDKNSLCQVTKMLPEDAVGLISFHLECWYTYNQTRNLEVLYIVDKNVSFEVIPEIQKYITKICTDFPELLL